MALQWLFSSLALNFGMVLVHIHVSVCSQGFWSPTCLLGDVTSTFMTVAISISSQVLGITTPSLTCLGWDDPFVFKKLEANYWCHGPAFFQAFSWSVGCFSTCRGVCKCTRVHSCICQLYIQNTSKYSNISFFRSLCYWFGNANM